MIYVHFYPQKPQNRALRTNKRERVYRSLTPGAGGEIRTPDLLFTRQLLYQLSYTGVAPL